MLVGAKIPAEKEADGKSCGCQGKLCEVCTFLEKKKALLLMRRCGGSDAYKKTRYSSLL